MQGGTLSGAERVPAADQVDLPSELGGSRLIRIRGDGCLSRPGVRSNVVDLGGVVHRPIVAAEDVDLVGVRRVDGASRIHSRGHAGPRGPRVGDRVITVETVAGPSDVARTYIEVRAAAGCGLAFAGTAWIRRNVAPGTQGAGA